MLPKDYFGKIVNFCINIWLGIGLTATGLYMNGMLTGEALATGFVVSMGVGYLICDLIPAVGPKVTKNMADSMAKNLLTTAITGFVYIFLISFFNLFVSAGIHVFSVWPRLFPVLYVVGYLILLIFMPLCVKTAEWMTK